MESGPLLGDFVTMSLVSRTENISTAPLTIPRLVIDCDHLVSIDQRLGTFGNPNLSVKLTMDMLTNSSDTR